MSDLKTTEEISRTPDGSEYVRLATTGANWKATLSSIFSVLSSRETVLVARTYYVNNVTGNDANTGLTALTAFRTIQHAVNLVCDSTYWLNCAPKISIAKTGTNYNEFILLRPWQGNIVGGGDEFKNTALIEGLTTDPTYQTGVLIKPTTDAGRLAVVVATGNGARWRVSATSVDASGNPVSGQGNYLSLDGAYLTVTGGDVGPVSDPTFLVYPQFSAQQNAFIRWENDSTRSHIYGTTVGGAPMLGFADHSSFCEIDRLMTFDNDPGYWVVLYATYNSDVVYGHNSGVAGVHPTGQRIALQDASRGLSRLSLTDMPGNSWTSALGAPVSPTSIFNWPSFPAAYTVATLPTPVFEGHVVTVTDSTTNVAGATPTGGGAFRVPLWYTGSGWVVLAPVTAAAGSLTVNTTPISSGTGKHVVYETTGNLFGEAANFTIESGNPNVTAGNAYLCAGQNAVVGDPANNNWFFGNAGNQTLSGSNNACVGAGAGAALTTGVQNVLLGSLAGTALTTAGENTAIGYSTMATATTGSFRSVAIGYGAMALGTGGTDNLGIGYLSLFSISGGTANVGMGPNTLSTCSTGDNNTALGSFALNGCTTGSLNSADGHSCLQNLTIGTSNLGQGGNALLSLIDGGNNVAIGIAALQSTQHDSNNLALGSNALNQMNGGSSNIALGAYAGYGTTTGSSNIIIGAWDNSDNTLTSGSMNIQIGDQTAVPSPTASNQLTIQNIIYGTNNSGSRSTASTGQIGIGVKAPTATLDLTASTTAQSSLRIRSGTAPTSPNDGDIWFDGTHLQIRIGGVTTQIV